MFLHIGNNQTIRNQDILGVFDLDTATVSQDTKAFLQKSEREGRSTLVAQELPKSFIVTTDGKVFLSQISTASLSGRSY